jgi:hypothetical protein
VPELNGRRGSLAALDSFQITVIRLASPIIPLVRKGEHERATDHLIQALRASLHIGTADGPRECLDGLGQCLVMLGDNRFSSACVGAGLSPQTTATLVSILAQRPNWRSVLGG